MWHLTRHATTPVGLYRWYKITFTTLCGHTDANECVVMATKCKRVQVMIWSTVHSESELYWLLVLICSAYVLG
jgi:hypothetical protein